MSSSVKSSREKVPVPRFDLSMTGICAAILLSLTVGNLFIHQSRAYEAAVLSQLDVAYRLNNQRCRVIPR